jgi:outer membrane immunogenic protein
MKKRVAIALLATSFTAGAACAADRPLLAPQFYPTGPLLPVEWTGFYFGANGGYSWGRGMADTAFIGSFPGGTTTPNGTGPAELSTTRLHSSGKPSGAIAGGQIGFNWQAGRFVFGAEADGQWLGQQASFAVGCSSSRCSGVQDVSIKTLQTGRARFGLAFDWIMPYVTAGAALVNVSDDLLVTKGGITGKFQSITGSTLGWTAGAGVDIALSSNWSARLEYLYVQADLSNTGPIPNTLGIGTVSASDSVKANIVRVGLNYRFGPRGGPGVLERPLAAPAAYASAYDFLPNMQVFADRSRSEKRAPTAPIPNATSAPVAIASADTSDFKLPATVAAEPRTAKPAYKNFDEIEDADLTGGTSADAKAITLPSLKRRPHADDDGSHLKNVMSICSSC